MLKNIEIFEDGENFEGLDEDQEQTDHVSTLMEYIHTSLSTAGKNKGGLEDGISISDWELLNEKLIRLRTSQILSRFRIARTDRDEEEDFYGSNMMEM